MQRTAPPGVPVADRRRSRTRCSGRPSRFGISGALTELVGDRVYRIPPISALDAAETVRAIKAAPLLFGYRGSEPVDVAAVEDLIRRVAQLKIDLPQVSQIDLMLVHATADGRAACCTPPAGWSRSPTPARTCSYAGSAPRRATRCPAEPQTRTPLPWAAWPPRCDSLGMAACDLTDADLLRAMAGRDEGALHELYERHAPWITLRLSRRCADADAVCDVLQDTFLAAWKGAGRFRGDGVVPAWLWGIAVRRLISRLRSRTGFRPGPALLEGDLEDISAEECVLLHLEHVDVGTALARISPELQGRPAADRPGRTEHRGGGGTPRHPARHREVTVATGQGHDARGNGMSVPTSSGWHLSEDALRHYTTGHTLPVAGASIEAHLIQCADCRARLGAGMPRETIDRAWDAIREQVETPRPSLVERFVRRLGFPSESARLLAAVPAFRGAWLLGVFVVLVFAGVAALFSGEVGLSLFLIVAPLVPVAGVAASFGGDADPAHELITTTPHSAFRLLLLRTLGVLATSVPLTAIVGVVLPGPAWLGAVWLLPAVVGVLLTLLLTPELGSTATPRRSVRAGPSPSSPPGASAIHSRWSSR